MKYKNIRITFWTGIENRPGYNEELEITNKSVSYSKEYLINDIYNKPNINGRFDKIEWKYEFDKNSDYIQLIEKLGDLILDYEYDSDRNTYSGDTDTLFVYVKCNPKGVKKVQIWQPIDDIKTMRDLGEIKDAIKRLVPDGEPMFTWFE